MTTTPFVHFLLPYYGSVDYLQETVRSVRQQEGDWRLTIVDDQSPYGDVRPWLDDLEDSRIEYLRNQDNLGLTRNFQRCLSLAVGEYSVFLGDDDRLLPGYVALLQRAHGQFSFDVFQPTVAIIDEQGARVSPLPDRIKSALRPKGNGFHTRSGDKATARLLTGNWTYFPSIAWRTAQIQKFGFSDQLLVTIDLGLLLNVLASDSTLAVHNGMPVFEYRRHAESVSSQQADDGPRFDEERQFFRAQRERFTTLRWTRSARAAQAHVTSRAYALLSLLRGGTHLSVSTRRSLWQAVVGR